MKRKWRENEKMKRKWRENGEMGKKWRENEDMERDSLSSFPHFLFISPTLTIPYIKNCCILPQNVKYDTFVANVTKKTYHTRYEKISLGRIRCESALQVVPAWKMTICMKRKVQEQKPGAALVSATVPRRIGGSLKLIAHVFCVPYASIAFIANHREKQVREKNID